jgi:hypothetical protein
VAARAPAVRTWAALAVALAAAAVLLVHQTRGTTLWFDEWQWLLYRRGHGLDTFLRPHNEHLSLVPIAVYKLLFATVGVARSAPYRGLVIAEHLLCVVLVFVYASRRVGGFLALLAAVVLLTLGPGWQNFLWPFQISWLTSLSAGVGALLMLDRADRAGDVAACGLLALSLAGSGIGLPIAAALVVEVLWRRRRSAWVVAGPLAVYAVWWVAYRPAGLVRDKILLTPRFGADAAAGAASALAGLGDAALTANGAVSAWGPPLVLCALALLAWRLGRLGRVPPRVAALLVALVGFWVLTGLRRAEFTRPDSSRYVYVGALLMLLLIVELAGGSEPRRPVRMLLAAAVAAIVVSNLGQLRAGARYLRDQAALARADLAALETGRPLVPPGYVAHEFPGYPFVVVRAGAYFSAARAFGTPADSEAQLAAAPEGARLLADAELARIDGVALGASRPRTAAAGAPAVDGAIGGTATASGACVSFRPRPAGPAEPAPAMALTLPAGGLALSAGGGPAAISVRRFAAEFQAPRLRLGAGATASLRIAADRAREPWHVRVAPAARAVACALG